MEELILNTFGPFVGNTHSESNKTGRSMSQSYSFAHSIIKKHVNANKDDIIITCGFGMTSSINKLQRILGFKICEKLTNYTIVPEELRPVIFITHMEHHSNHISWLETYSDVICLKSDENGLVDINNLEIELKKYSSRKIKIGSFTASSNITGIQTPYHQMAKLMHQYGGTVNWTNPWGEKGYISNIEVREDGGTPGFLQAIKTALCISVKNDMALRIF